jgi:hypothetical protein
MTSDIRHDPLAELSAQGVAVWLDHLSRELLASGELQVLTTGRQTAEGWAGLDRGRPPAGP